jgi:5-methylcytosine-specific restriction endonuclease McrA
MPAFFPGQQPRRPAEEEYRRYLQSDHWLAVRRRALEYAEHRCQVCYSPDRLQVHHRTYARLGQERPADMTVLCEDCHRNVHGKRRRGPFIPR